MQQINMDEFVRMWEAGPDVYTSREICRRFGISKTHLHRLRVRLGLERRSPAVPEKAVVDIPLLFKLWNMSPHEMPTTEISKRLGVSLSLLYRTRSKYKLPDRERVCQCASEDPTEEEIAERAAAIRASWPEGEAERRMVGCRGRRWSPPAFNFHPRQSAFVSCGKSVDV